MVWATAALAQDVTGLRRSFARLEATTETGVNYRDYGQLVGDANAELKMYQSTSGAKPAAIAELKLAIMLHVEASELWGLTFGRPKMDAFYTSSDIWKDYAKRYPDANREAANGGALLGQTMYTRFILPFIWRDAATHARDGLKLL